MCSECVSLVKNLGKQTKRAEMILAFYFPLIKPVYTYIYMRKFDIAIPFICEENFDERVVVVVGRGKRR